MQKHRRGSVEAIGANIKTLRTRKGWTQAEAGEVLGVSWQQFAKYETGKNRITADALFKLARLFRIKPALFFE